MLYKPKNMHPRLGSDQPIIYLDKIKDGTVDFTFNIDGNDIIQKISCDVNDLQNTVLNFKEDYSLTNAFIYSATQRGKVAEFRPPAFVFPINGECIVEDNNIYNHDYGARFYKSSLNTIDYDNAYIKRYINYCHIGNVGNYEQIATLYCYDLENQLTGAAWNVDAKLSASSHITQVYNSIITNNYWGVANIENRNDNEAFYVGDIGKNYLNGRGAMVWGEVYNDEKITITSENEIFISKSQLTTNSLFSQIKIKQPQSSSLQIQPTIRWNSIAVEQFFATNNDFKIVSIDTLSDDDYILYCANSNTVVDPSILSSDIVKRCRTYATSQINNLQIHLKWDSMRNQYGIQSIVIPPKSMHLDCFTTFNTPRFNTHTPYLSWDGIAGNLNLDIVLYSNDNISLNLKDEYPNIYPNQLITYKSHVSNFMPGDYQYQLIINDAIRSDKTLFKIAEKSPLVKTGINNNEIYSSYLNLNGTFNSSELNEQLIYYQWKLYRGVFDEKTDQINGNLVYQTPKIYSQDFQFEYDNLIPGEYVIEAIVEDNYGQIWSKREPFSVDYEQNDLSLNLHSELDKENTGVKLKWDKPEYGVAVDHNTNSNLTLTEDLFAWMTKDQKLNYKENLIKDGVLDLTYNEPGVPILDNIVTYLFNSEPYLNINNTKMCYFSFLGQIYLDITKKKILVPHRTLNDFFGGRSTYYCTELRIQKDINGKYRPYIQTLFGNHKSVEFENFENPYTETGYYDIYCQYNFKDGTYKIATKKTDQSKWITAETQTNLIPTTSIIFYTGLENISAIDYVLVTSKETCYEDNTPYLGKDISYEFENSEDTIYLNFNSIDNIWSVKNPTAAIAYTGYNMKRYNPLTQKVLNMGQYYFTPQNTEEERRFVDYSLPHNEEVKYLIYPQGNKIITDEENSETSQELIFSPVYSDSIKGDWDKWCLFTTRGPAPKNLDGTADNGYNENVLLVDKVFFFEMNVETGNMKNNTDFSVIKNFTPYPHIQRSPSNYWSGQLKGLLGRLAIDDCTFKQTPTMLQEIKELTQNTSRKFLKDRDGNFWEVELSSDITIDNNDKLDVQLKTKSFNWVEVGDASDIALVSVGPGREDWLLTELGQEQIDISRYVWDDNAIWDDSDFWTESE